MTSEQFIKDLKVIIESFFGDSSEWREEIEETLVIPKPKFKVGDHVYDKINSDPYEDYDFIIKSVFYNIEEGTYYYHGAEMDYIRSESDLELMEVTK